MAPATWSKLLSADILQRSSQIISLTPDNVYIFGGELRPREPRDNDVHVVQTSPPHTSSTITAATSSPSPSPRVGSASTTLHGKIYLFSGRGGVAMAPIEENGGLWEFTPTTSTWRLITPASSTAPYPPARSYHCMANDGDDTIYVHAGCPEKGRLSDLWAFRLSSREWTALAAAPDPPRGGTSIAFADGRLYRMNGFDGKAEQGGHVDVYDPSTNVWITHAFAADGVAGPGPRSVAALLPVRLDSGLWLVTLFGECDPSALGHQGAGKMLGDVWAFHVEDRVWKKVDVTGSEAPCPRGWFAADGDGGKTIVVQGGLDESNQRLGDVWKLSF
ncbi:galactose oxidase/kelch, beta-propeller [Aspergillus terreus]|uniref:Galactose oxidase/kelch, beta-propeller n=1 Tax=Aspergillus terreus TaxID=33178 RepID=A0A5M3YVE1_ASPTE|nr:hypothetical protein ATETN484_0004008700 [Aspergillus terreus]GFF12977.1 galactose oxidase/kelch, beta-propeller [Aspergillus terreus]